MSSPPPDETPPPAAPAPQRPRLARRARLRVDHARGRHVLLVPEAVLALTPSAAEILALCDGARTLEAIIAELGARHPGAPIARDVTALLARLHAQHLVDDAPAASSAPAAPPARLATTVAPRTLTEPAPPVALLAELTYRCPLRCGYCSNPTDMRSYRDELDTASWARVFREAEALGVLQLHLSGGEPLVRDDLAQLVAAAREAGLYTNLITSAYGLSDARLDELARAGLDHVQVSLQDTTAERGDPIAGTTVHAQKLAAARAVKARGLGLSINVVIHRANADRVGEIIALADELGAERLELANAQYHGWALKNRDALLPDRAALERGAAIAAEARARIGARMAILYVLPDYYTDYPKPCMNGWARQFVTVAPDGTALPCPGAHALPLAFERVRARSLGDIWRDSPAFTAYRGAGWMREPCASCERREVDFGGCRCQAFALTGDAAATDPACSRSPHHGLITAARARAADPDAPRAPVLYRVRTAKPA